MAHPDLLPSAKLVFTALAMEGLGAVRVKASCRTLAKATHLKKSQVAAALVSLAKAELIEADRAVRGRGRTYRILHPQFGWEPPKKNEVCPSCKRKGFSLGASGMCGECVETLRRKMAKTA